MCLQLVQEGGGTAAINQLQAAIEANMTTAETVDAAFRRLFYARIALGMLDPPTMNPYNAVPYDVVEVSRVVLWRCRR
jgi:hypothetical protein